MKYPLKSLKSLQSYFFILALFMRIKADETTQDQNTVCGQYGFNCLNDKTLKFCPIVVDGVTDIAQYLECDDNYECDEDNPSFCTPKEEPNKILQDKGRSGLVNDDRLMNSIGADKYYDGANTYYRQSRDLDNIASLEGSLMFFLDDTSTTDSSDEYDFTTIDFTPASPFDCSAYGFFPDSENSSLFWHCDVPLNGVGFLLRHMKCGHDRYFDKYLRSCIQEGTIRRQKRKYNPENNGIAIFTKKIKSSSDCKNLKPGKYADAFDCHVYHLCSPKELSPITQLSFVCPRGTAYDCLSQTCTIAAFKRCEVKNHIHPSLPLSSISSNINCTSPMRFRSIDNCRSYFVCFMDNVIEIKCPKFYKFDDNSMECLPEKLANCIEFPV
ncbi:uncharacterized protein LOC129948307 [Eupeodes corollae]|uniref:uncharacterized protein LOC129948307 n=1 Tax=Eupeodes corollae TaxID=290404 RepID=UPI002490D0FC|nr:uncharacterized protein LOC129948307 [Eupeodes corollae]